MVDRDNHESKPSAAVVPDAPHGGARFWNVDLLLAGALAFILTVYTGPALNLSRRKCLLLAGGLCVLLIWLVGILRRRWLAPRLKDSSRRACWAWVGGSLLAGSLVVGTNPIPEPGIPLWLLGRHAAALHSAHGPEVPFAALAAPGQLSPRRLVACQIYRWLALTCLVVAVAYLFLLGGVGLASRSWPASSGSSWLIPAICCAAIWTIYLLLFWPGLMNADAFDQWEQMESWTWIDHHPVFHTFATWLVTRLWLSPAAVVVAQIVALSAVFGWALSVMRSEGTMPRWAVILTCLGVALVPSHAIMAISPAKDTPFSIALLALTVLVLKAVRSDGAWLERRWSWLWLGLVGALTVLFRMNGFIAAVGAIVLLQLRYPRSRLRLGGALAVIAVVWAAYKGPFWQWLEVVPSTQMPHANYVALHHIGAHVAAKTELTAEEQALLARIRPSQEVWEYRTDTADSMIYDGKFNFAEARQSSGELIRLALKLDWRAPETAWNHVLASSSYLWRIVPVGNEPVNGVCLWLGGHGEVYTMDVRHDTSVFSPHSLLPRWQRRVAGRIQQSYSEPPWNWLLWRPALYLYLGLAAGLIAVARGRSLAWLLVLAPALLNAAGLALLAPSQTHRYGYPLQLVAMTVAGFLFFGVPRKQAAAAEQSETAPEPIRDSEPRQLAA